MVKRTGPTNIHLRKLIQKLKKTSREYNAPIWKRVAELLERPTRRRIIINLKQIDRLVSEGDSIVVPGKVLGYGKLNKKITIAAWRYSNSAKKKLEGANCKILTIEELIENNPKGSNIKIII